MALVREGLGRFEQKMNNDNGMKIGWSTTKELMIGCSTKTGLMEHLARVFSHFHLLPVLGTPTSLVERTKVERQRGENFFSSSP